ncbi:MAG TPA: hypothetical protein DCS63_00870 [Elusimicrobia bacterium]|nr:hypothetical protein [Elusimicrobiota bacterium]
MKRYKRFEIYLNSLCNQKCLHCFNGKHFRKSNEGPGFSRICADMLKMRKQGFDWLSFLGGEPTIHPEIIKIVSLAKIMGYRRLMTYSNGLKYSDPDFTARIKKAGLTDTCLSVHGHTPGLHEAVTGVPGSFRKVMRAVENLGEFGINVTLILVLNALNKGKLKEILRFYSSKGIKHYMIFFLKYQGRLIENGPAAKKLMFRVSELTKTLAGLPALAAKEKIRIHNIEHAPYCVVPENCRTIISGTDYGGARMVIQSGELLNISSSHKGYIFKSSCADCRYYSDCPGIDPEYAKIFGLEEFSPVPRSRRSGRRGVPYH